jgi:hypothetical protein
LPCGTGHTEIRVFVFSCGSVDFRVTRKIVWIGGLFMSHGRSRDRATTNSPCDPGRTASPTIADHPSLQTLFAGPRPSVLLGPGPRGPAPFRTVRAEYRDNAHAPKNLRTSVTVLQSSFIAEMASTFVGDGFRPYGPHKCPTTRISDCPKADL